MRRTEAWRISRDADLDVAEYEVWRTREAYDAAPSPAEHGALAWAVRELDVLLRGEHVGERCVPGRVIEFVWL